MSRKSEKIKEKEKENDLTSVFHPGLRHPVARSSGHYTPFFNYSEVDLVIVVVVVVTAAMTAGKPPTLRGNCAPV